MAKIRYTRLNRAMKDWGKLLVALLKKTMKQEDLHASGATAKSISYSVDSTDTSVRMSILGRQKGTYQIINILDKGRAPGRRMPPVDAIQRWMEEKGLPNRKRSVAYIIAKSIGERGMIKRFQYRGANIFDKAFSPVQDKLGMEILEAYGEDIQAYIDKHLPKQNTRRT